MKNTVEILVAGKTYKIKGNEDEQEILEAAKYLNKIIKEIEESDKNIVLKEEKLVLAAINLADEIIKLKGL